MVTGIEECLPGSWGVFVIPETRTLVTITSEWTYPYKYAGQEIGVYVRDRDAMYVGTLLDPYGKEVQLVLDYVVHHAGCVASSMTTTPSL
jgi:hypothetical protein